MKMRLMWMATVCGFSFAGPIDQGTTSVVPAMVGLMAYEDVAVVRVWIDQGAQEN